jgi:hypothetical protein
MSAGPSDETVAQRKAREAIADVVEKYAEQLENLAWVSEADRWAELVFCLISQCTPQGPEASRKAIGMLQDLALLVPAQLAALENEDDEDAIVIARVLKRHGFKPDEARTVVRLISHVAGWVTREYEGKVQRYLRQRAEAMRDELVKAFSNDTLCDERLRYGVTLWLQNALNLPLSLEHDAVKQFCQDNGMTITELQNASDALDVNLALIDDLVDLLQDTKRQAAVTQMEA